MSEYKHYFTTNLPPHAKVVKTLMFFAIPILLIGGGISLLYIHAKTHLPLRTTINGIVLNNLPQQEATHLLTQQIAQPTKFSIIIKNETTAVASSSDELGAHYNPTQAIKQVMEIEKHTHTRDTVYSVLNRFFSPQEIQLPIEYEDSKLEEFIAAFKEKVDNPPIEPQVKMTISGRPETLTVHPGQLGQIVAVPETLAAIKKAPMAATVEVVAPMTTVGTILTTEQQTQLLERSKKFVGASLIATHENIRFALDDTQLVSLLSADEKINEEAVKKLLTTFRNTVNRPPQEPVFSYDKDSLIVKKFVPPKDGLTLDINATTVTIEDALKKIETEYSPESKAEKTHSFTLTLAKQKPTTPLASLNDLGIVEQIGFGNSYYAHSIPNRIHNVALAASRISLDIVKPGEEFSFNKHLGDVSAATGFKSAYVIQGNKTVLGDGGGVCQVSTTLFRAVLNAGLPVTRRLPHSYRVSYYELDSKPGIDATVYSGETDFRFKNDTDHYILIYGEADSKNLYMYYELYGTSDGRSAEIVDHKTWNYRPAPAAVYIPDSSLPTGKKVQVDWAAAGISASFKNIVKDKSGAIIREETYVSNYRPWSAKYLVGAPQ